jgi:hypothetical protein
MLRVDRTDGKPGFWTTLSWVLTGLTGLLGAVVALLILEIPDHHPDRTPEPHEKTFFARLDALEHPMIETCPQNSWYAYVIDFNGLGDITRDYVRYIQQNPNADRDDLVLQKLQTSLEVFRIRNEAGAKDYDRTNLHSREFPRKFRMILDAIESKKRTGLSVDDERAFEAAIQNWFIEAGFPPSTTIAETITPWCLFN